MPVNYKELHKYLYYFIIDYSIGTIFHIQKSWIQRLKVSKKGWRLTYEFLCENNKIRDKKKKKLL